MKKITIQFGKNGMKVLGDGVEILSPKTFELTITGGEGDEITDVHEGIDDDQSEEPKEEDKAIYYEDFSNFDAEVSQNRLIDCKKDWAIYNAIAENNKSVHIPANVQVKDGILNLFIRNVSAKYGAVEKPYTTGYVFSKQMFGKGQLDMRVNLCDDPTIKNTIWFTSSPMQSKHNLRYLFELDLAEYTPAYTGKKNVSRGAWVWVYNPDSTDPKKKLPRNYPKEGYSLSPGSWYWSGKENGWVLSNVYPIYLNGNRLKGYPNNKLYYITNTERNVAVNSSKLTWIREDGVEGVGLDGNQYFVVTEREAIGKGANITQFLDGDTNIGGWHTWTLVVDDDFIAFLCDGKEYWKITNDELHDFPIQDGIQFKVIFATTAMGNLKKEQVMQVDWVRFTPQESKQKEYTNEIEPYNGD